MWWPRWDRSEGRREEEVGSKEGGGRGVPSAVGGAGVGRAPSDEGGGRRDGEEGRGRE